MKLLSKNSDNLTSTYNARREIMQAMGESCVGNIGISLAERYSQIANLFRSDNQFGHSYSMIGRCEFKCWLWRDGEISG